MLVFGIYHPVDRMIHVAVIEVIVVVGYLLFADIGVVSNVKSSLSPVYSLKSIT